MKGIFLQYYNRFRRPMRRLLLILLRDYCWVNRLDELTFPKCPKYGTVSTVMAFSTFEPKKSSVPIPKIGWHSFRVRVMYSWVMMMDNLPVFQRTLVERMISMGHSNSKLVSEFLIQSGQIDRM